MRAAAALLFLASALGSSAAAAAPGGSDGALQVEEVRLPRSALVITVDALAARITLHGGARLPALRSALCPQRTNLGRDAELRCTSRQLAASLDGGVLRISALRAPPAHDGDASVPHVAWDAALLASHPTLRPMHDELRAGDDAWQRGDLEAAARLWNGVGANGWLARLAGARLCEALGSCGPVGYDAFATQGLPPAMAHELTLRRARVLAYRGDTDGALRALIDAGDTAAVCAHARALCVRLARLGLVDDPGARVGALALLIALDAAGSSELPLADQRLAADTARALGAPRLAAQLLAAAAQQTASAQDRRELLALAADAYADAGDDAAADAVSTYAAASGRAKGAPSARAQAHRAAVAAARGSPAPRARSAP
jgi:hypothetical protein